MTKCRNGISTFSFDATIITTAVNAALVSAPSIPVQVGTDFTSGLNIFPIKQGKDAKAGCVDTNGNVITCIFPNAVIIGKDGLYRVKIAAEISSATSPQLLGTFLSVNGLINPNGVNLKVLYQNVYILMELGLFLKKGDILQISVQSQQSGATLNIMNSKFVVANITSAKSQYAEFNTTLNISNTEIVKLPFNNLIPNKFAQVKGSNQTVLKFRQSGYYKFHLYIDALLAFGSATESFYPFEIKVLVDDKIIKIENGYLLILPNQVAFIHTINSFFETDIDKNSNLEIIITSPANVLYGIQSLNSLLEILQTEQQC